MAVVDTNIVEYKWNQAGEKMVMVEAKVDDASDLPTTGADVGLTDIPHIAPGSTAFVIRESNAYMMDSSSAWVLL